MSIHLDTFTLLFCMVIVMLFITIAVVLLKKRKRDVAPHDLTDNADSTSHTDADLVLYENNMADVAEIILSTGLGQELVLMRPDVNNLANRKYHEICATGSTIGSRMVQGAMPVLAQAQTLSEIAKSAPDGLFTATASVADLMKLSDGTVGSAVMKNGKIVAQKGFNEIVASGNLNPAMIVGVGMQAMAAISGQYYMHQISAQLHGIDKKLDKLVGFHHDEKIGVLKNINRNIGELTNKSNVDAGDIIVIQRLKEKADEIFFEYHTRLEDVDITDVKAPWFRKTNELRKLNEKIDKDEIDFSILVCFHASELSMKCKLTEIAIRLKIGGQAERIKSDIERLYLEYDAAFCSNVNNYVNDLYAPVLQKATEIVEGGKIKYQGLWWKDAVPNEFDNIKQRKDSLHERVEQQETKKTVEQMLKVFNQPQEIIYLQGDNPDEQRVFVLAEEDD